MNKLGLRITNNGREAYVANPNQDWELHTVDFNACLLAMEGIDEGDDVVILSHDAGGCYVGIVKLLKMGFNGVCVAGSVFVPVDLSVDGKTVLNYVDEVRRQLSSAVLDGAKLDRLFAAEFPQKDFVPPFVPSSGEGFASRIVDFNGEELEQLLDSLYLFQSAYSHYKAILIVDKNSGIKVNATDITDEPLIMPEPEPEPEPEPDLKVVVVEDSEPQEEGELADEATYSESDSSEGVEVIVVDKPDSDKPIVNIEEEGLSGADIEIVEDEEGRPENLVAEVEGSVPNGLETVLDETGLEDDTGSSVVEVVDLPESESRGEARISYSRSLPTPPPPPDALPDPSDAIPTPPASDMPATPADTPAPPADMPDPLDAMPAPQVIAVPVEPTSLSGTDNDSLPTDDGVEVVELSNDGNSPQKSSFDSWIIVGLFAIITVAIVFFVVSKATDSPSSEVSYSSSVSVLSSESEYSLASVEEVKSEDELKREIYEAYVAQLESKAAVVNADAGGLCEYFLFDITGDGIPELWVISGTCEADYMLYVYRYGIGQLELMHSTGAGHSSFYCGDNYVLQVMAHTGEAGWYKIELSGSGLSEELVYEESDVESSDEYAQPVEPDAQMHDYDVTWPIASALE